MTRIYAARSAQRPNDLALADLNQWLDVLRRIAPDVRWLPRTRFAALLDIADAAGETLRQAPVAGLAVDLLTPASVEATYLRLGASLEHGRLPQHSGEILVSDRLFGALGLTLDQRATLIGSGMDGGMAVANFTVVGTVRFGIVALDRGAVIADLKDIQKMLFMDNAAGEIIGLLRTGVYDDRRATQLVREFNSHYAGVPADKFRPMMITLEEQGDLGDYLEMARNMAWIITVVFVAVITLVFWNAGIRGGIRRYAEFGLRLAIGESKRHLYMAILAEALVIGIAGSVIGTALGLLPSWYFMHFGFDLSVFTNNAGATLLTPNVIYARITPTTLWIGFLPGIFATVLGSAMAASAIFRRQTAVLIKELEL